MGIVSRIRAVYWWVWSVTRGCPGVLHHVPGPTKTGLSGLAKGALLPWIIPPGLTPPCVIDSSGQSPGVPKINPNPGFVYIIWHPSYNSDVNVKRRRQYRTTVGISRIDDEMNSCGKGLSRESILETISILLEGGILFHVFTKSTLTWLLFPWIIFLSQVTPGYGVDVHFHQHP
jgi:hypothetical protein